MPDVLTAARAMELPAAAVSRVARRAQIGIDDAEVVVARLVLDLRDAGWFVERSAVSKYLPLPDALPPVDPRVARALAELSCCLLFSADEPTPQTAARTPANMERLLRIAQGTIE